MKFFASLSPSFRSLVSVALLIATQIVYAVVEQSPNVKSRASNKVHEAVVMDIIRLGDTLFLAGEYGHIAWSDDSGSTWHQANVPTTQTITKLHFETRELGWAVAYDGIILNTVDGGKNWSMQVDGLAFNVERAKKQMVEFEQKVTEMQKEIDALYEELAAAEEAGADNVEDLRFEIEDMEFELEDVDFYKRDAEKIVSEENAPWPLMDVWFQDINHGFAVGAFNTLLETHDGGKSWEDVSFKLDNPDGFHLNAITGEGSYVYIVGEAGLVLRSQDNGATWETLESPDYGSFFVIHLEQSQDAENLTVWVMGLRGTIYKSADAGNSWSSLDSKQDKNINGAFFGQDGLLLAVGNDGALMVSSDGGENFSSRIMTNRQSISQVQLAPNGFYVLAGASGIQLVKPLH
jgi:photosystem II stability/assembly factor-like uncharacterized protein